MPDPIRIDVWSDVACPWCYLGKRKLEAGIAAYRAREHAAGVHVTFRSYQLAPELPADAAGTATQYLVERRGMDRRQVAQMHARLTSLAAQVGLEYHLEDVVMANTAKGHELLHHARAHGRQGEVAERLFAAHFVEGRHLGRLEELADLAAEAGLDRAEALAALQSHRYATAVAADAELGRRYGISGVPFFVLDERFGISGAQPAEVFADALLRVHGQ